MQKVKPRPTSVMPGGHKEASKGSMKNISLCFPGAFMSI